MLKEKIPMKNEWTLFAITILLAMMLTQTSMGRGGGSVNAGVWGGPHLRMDVTPQGASLEFDCAQGTIAEPLLLDPSGKFQVKGTFRPQHGGPIRKDEPSNEIGMVYTGIVEGDSMQLEFTLPADAGTPEKFTLVRGQPGRVVKCG